MIKEEMKIGPKGQVVIPKVFRKILGIVPGSKVLIELEDDRIVIEKPRKDVAGVFKDIAFSGERIVERVHPHLGYDESLESRGEKAAR